MRARGAVLLLWRAVLSLCHRRAVRELLDCAAVLLWRAVFVCAATVYFKIAGPTVICGGPPRTRCSACMSALGALFAPDSSSSSGLG